MNATCLEMNMNRKGKTNVMVRESESQQQLVTRVRDQATSDCLLRGASSREPSYSIKRRLERIGETANQLKS